MSINIFYFVVFSLFYFKFQCLNVFPFRNISLSWNERVDDLVSRLTLEEIQGQLTEGGGNAHSHCPAISRLEIKPFTFDTECLHGVNNNATGFPQSIGLARSFNKKLLFNVGNVIGREARAGYNYYSSMEQYGVDQGMVCLTPVINIYRHPLWGRNQETYGEDPFLSGELANEIILGLQGPKDYRYMQAATGCKHFDAYTGPENIPVSRFSFNANISEIDFHLTFLPAFRPCARHASAVMCSYNAINGIPACANKNLLTNQLRKKWNFKGYVISDMGAIQHIYDSHKYTSTLIDAVAEAMNSGCNFNMPGGSPPYKLLVEAVNAKKILEKTVRSAIKPLFMTRMKLGEFDPSNLNYYNTFKFHEIVKSRAHTELALLSAIQSFVLLKNDNQILPILHKPKNVLIVGPFSNNPSEQFGSYPAKIDIKLTTTPYSGLKSIADNVLMIEGCSNSKCQKYNRMDIVNGVSSSYDYVIICLGLGFMEGEGNDRSNLELPKNQTMLIQDVLKFKSKNSRLILILFAAGAVDISWAKNYVGIEAILLVGYPAQATGIALLKVLTFSDNFANPAGRLAETWPITLNEILPITDYSMKSRTYRYSKTNILYPFGYGLSYTNFKYYNLRINKGIVEAGKDTELQVSVANIGKYVGDEVAQVYINWPNSKLTMPNLQLAAFHRIECLPPQQSTIIKFKIPFHIMAGWDTIKKKYMIEEGSINIYVGGQQPFQETFVESNILSDRIFINGQYWFD